MDADGLPIVGPGIDLTKVDPIHQKRTLAFLNHFITHTVQFMNKFSCVCEEKLASLAVRMQRLETTMSILEAKLNSIPGLENVTVAATTTTTTSTEPGPTQQQQQSEQQQNTSSTQQTAESQHNVDIQVEEKSADQSNNPVSQDPRYAKYFKMVAVGVPAAAIKQKMLLEGLDPDILDTPNAAAPSGGGTAHQNDDTDQSDDEGFSDSENSEHFSDSD